MDAPTTFWWNGGEYRPKNFEGESTNRMVSLRYALSHSLNIPTVALGEKVGWESVVQMARRAGMNDRIQPTPAVALGAYDVTPIEAVGAYTMFANGGRYVKPDFLELVRDQVGKELYRHKEQSKQVLDQRVAYIMTNPAAGRSDSRHCGGRSRDGRFRRAGRREDGDLARRMVCRLHLGAALRGMGSGLTTIAISISRARVRPLPSGWIS